MLNVFLESKNCSEALERNFGHYELCIINCELIIYGTRK